MSTIHVVVKERVENELRIYYWVTCAGHVLCSLHNTGTVAAPLFPSGRPEASGVSNEMDSLSPGQFLSGFRYGFIFFRHIF